MNDSPCRSLTFQLLGTLSSVQARLEASLEPLGLSLAKFGVLSQLVQAGEPIPFGTLAERCSCVRSNITQLVDRLEAEKLVLRQPDPKDRRSVRAELSAAGRERYDAGLKALTAAEDALFAPLSAQQREDLVSHLTLLRSTGVLQEAM